MIVIFDTDMSVSWLFGNKHSTMNVFTILEGLSKKKFFNASQNRERMYGRKGRKKIFQKRGKQEEETF